MVLHLKWSIRPLLSTVVQIDPMVTMTGHDTQALINTDVIAVMGYQGCTLQCQDSLGNSLLLSVNLRFDLGMQICTYS